MNKPLIVPEKPCESCPYSKLAPPGIWDKSEYNKLPEYDENPPSGTQALSVFLCHHSPQIGKDSVCRGWLSVHQHSVAVRLGMMCGSFTPEQVYAKPLVPLYKTGSEAAAAGIARIKRPSKSAKQKIRQIFNQQVKLRRKRRKK